MRTGRVDMYFLFAIWKFQNILDMSVWLLLSHPEQKEIFLSHRSSVVKNISPCLLFMLNHKRQNFSRESLWPLLPSTFHHHCYTSCSTWSLSPPKSSYLIINTKERDSLFFLKERERKGDWFWRRVWLVGMSKSNWEKLVFAISRAAVSGLGFMSAAGHGDARDEHSGSLRLWHEHKYMYVLL